MEFATFTAAYDSNAEKADEDTQLKLTELQ
jgi:hypothetical protein